MGPGAFAAPYCTLLTDERYDLLLARLPQERIRLGRRLSGFTETADGVELEFADGAARRPTCWWAPTACVRWCAPG
nr:hypothetical protein [Streptomyces sp. CNQ-509]